MLFITALLALQYSVGIGCCGAFLFQHAGFTVRSGRLPPVLRAEPRGSELDDGLVPASATVKTATAQQQDNDNDDQNCGDIHISLHESARPFRRSPLLPWTGRHSCLSLDLNQRSAWHSGSLEGRSMASAARAACTFLAVPVTFEVGDEVWPPEPLASSRSSKVLETIPGTSREPAGLPIFLAG